MTAKSTASEGKKKSKGKQVDQAESKEQRHANDAAGAARRARKAEEQRPRRSGCSVLCDGPLRAAAQPARGRLQRGEPESRTHSEARAQTT